MTDLRLHLGCGKVILPGWVNVDIKPGPGVDHVLDVRDGLPFSDAAYIYAEHFVEHFTFDEALRLLGSCRRMLHEHGVLRLTTPNLDWVWATSYSSRWVASNEMTATIALENWRHDEAAARDCLLLNRAFRAWGHKFLYNAGMLTEILRRVGFERIESSSYGTSRHPALINIEHHNRYPDSAQLSHLLIVEASGLAAPRSTRGIDDLIAEYRRDIATE